MAASSQRSDAEDARRRVAVHPPEAARRLRREPRRELICLDAETAIAEGGAGLAISTLSDDDDGVVAHGAQSLLVAPRSA